MLFAFLVLKCDVAVMQVKGLNTLIKQSLSITFRKAPFPYQHVMSIITRLQQPF